MYSELAFLKKEQLFGIAFRQLAQNKKPKQNWVKVSS